MALSPPTALPQFLWLQCRDGRQFPYYGDLPDHQTSAKLGAAILSAGGHLCFKEYPAVGGAANTTPAELSRKRRPQGPISKRLNWSAIATILPGNGIAPRGCFPKKAGPGPPEVRRSRKSPGWETGGSDWNGVTITVHLKPGERQAPVGDGRPCFNTGRGTSRTGNSKSAS